MSHSITISEPVFALLDQEAKRKRVSPNDLAEQVLAEHLSADRQEWRIQFDALLERVRARTRDIKPDEIEADITAASEEEQAIHPIIVSHSHGRSTAA